MNFAHAPILWFLLVLPPALVIFFWWSLRERQRLMTQFIQARLLPGLISGVSIGRQKFRFLCLIAAVSAILLAMARPQWGSTWEQTKQKGLDIVVAIDTSKSMLAEDITPNRLVRAKLAALDLMRLAKTDRIGLVAFAGSAFLQCPLTIDDSAFRQSLDALDVNIIPQGGTALAEAIKTAQTAFKEGENFKVLVLFTDGEDNDEGALAAAEAAGKDGMKIFTVGIGTPGGEILRLRDAKGRTDYIRDADGNAVKSRLNEGLLQQIAGATEGGFYLPLRGAKTVETLYERGLAPLPKSEGQEKLVRHLMERYHWPLAAAIALLLLEMLLPQARHRRSTAANLRDAARAGAAVPALIVALFWFSTAAAWSSPASALRKYQAGDYPGALGEFRSALEKRKDDPRLQFDAGTAAYREKKFDEAAEHFGAALAARDLKLQEHAYYNLGNTLFRTGEAESDPKKQTDSWEKAVQQYDFAIRLNTNNADARFNRDFVKKKLEDQKQNQKQKPPPDPSEAAKKAKAAADEAVRRREYRRALDIMEDQLKQDSTTSHYSDYIQRLREINGVANPAPH